MELAIQIQIEELPEGVILATSDELPGLVAQGRTVAEAQEIACDVARKLIEARRERDGILNLPRQRWDCGLCGHGLLRVGNRWVSREDVRDVADAKEVPDPIVQAGEEQAPAIPFEGHVDTDDDAQSAGVHIPDAAHVDYQRGGLVLAHRIAKTRRCFGIQHPLEHHDRFARARTIAYLKLKLVPTIRHNSVECITRRWQAGTRESRPCVASWENAANAVSNPIST
jgi:predicted RNase H-like HicB family nuclease